MKKRLEQFKPDPAFDRPTAQSEEAKKNADAFAEHLASMLRAEKQANEESAPPRPKPIDIPAAPRSPELQPARLETRPSAQEALEPFSEENSDPADGADETPPRIREDLSDKPFVPPEEDPSLEEIFRFSAEETELEETPPEEASEEAAEEAAEQTVPVSEDTPAQEPSEDDEFDKTVEEILAEALVTISPDEILAKNAAPSPLFQEDSSPEPPEPSEELSQTPAVEETPPEPPPRSQEPTGPLPSLEELFGAEEESVEAAPLEPAPPEPPAATEKPPQAPGRFVRRGKLRSLLDSLLTPQVPEEPEEAPGPEPEAQPENFPEPEPLSPEPGRPATGTIPELDVSLLEDPFEGIDMDALNALLEEDILPQEEPVFPEEPPAPEAEKRPLPESVPSELSAPPRDDTPEAEATPPAESETLPEPVAPEPEEAETGAEEPRFEEPGIEEPELTLDAIFGSASESGPEPEPAPPSESDTVPMNLTEQAPAPTEPPPKPKKPRRGSTTMTLEELLAAAVPIEETPSAKAPPPKPADAPLTPAARRRKRNRDHAGLRSKNDPFAAVKAAASSARAEVSASMVPLTEETDAPARKAEAAPPQAEKRREETPPPKAPEPQEAPELPRWAPDPREKEAASQAPPSEPEQASRQGEDSADPVPSADAWKEEARAQAAARSAPPRQEKEPHPPEEAELLHPEEAYKLYADPLDQIGTKLILTGLFTIFSLFFTLYLSKHWTFLPEIFSGGTTVYIQLGLLILMVMTNRSSLFRWKPAKGGPGSAPLLGLAALFTAIDCFPAASSLRSPFTVVVGALLMIFLWGEYDRCLGLATTVKSLRGDSLASGVSEVPEISKGSRGLVRTPPDVNRFMEKLETRDLTQRVLGLYTPVAAVISMGLTLLFCYGLKRDFAWTGALVFLGSVPVAGLLAYPRIFLLLSRRLADADAALCGYHGAEVFGGDHAILIGDEDIFPAGSLTLNGFKLYNGNSDRIIAYAAAAARHSESALDPVFDDLLVTHNCRHYEVDDFRFYDSGGIGASIQEDVVLMGSLEFMRRMGVHMDKGARVKQAVYMSLNGELAAVFAIRYAPPENLRKGLSAIAGNRHFKGILTTRTFLGTPGFLKAKFGIPTGSFLYPSTAERIRLSEAELKRTGAQGAILAKDSFSGFAQAVAAGRMLRSASLGSAILTVLSGISGLLLMGVLAAIPAVEAATALNLLIYCMAWLVPTLLLTTWGKHF